MQCLQGGNSIVVPSFKALSSSVQTVTKGIACHGQDCEVRMHHHCFKNYRGRPRTDSCPGCKIAWPQENVKPLLRVGEDAARDRDDGRRRVRAKTEEEDTDEDADMEQDEASQSQSQTQASQAPKRTQRSRKGKAKVVDSDDDEDE